MTRESRVRSPRSLEREAYEAIATFQAENGFAPSLDDLASILDRHRSTVYAAIQRLEASGALERRVRGARTIVLKQQPEIQL